MGFMHEFPHSRQFDSDLREIIELYKSLIGIPDEINKLQQNVTEFFNNLDINDAIDNKIESMYADDKFAKYFNVGVHNVKNYGAKGDGVSDDSVAIVNAIASAKNGDVVFFPAGVYNIRSEITISKSCQIVGASAFNSDSFPNIADKQNGTIINAINGSNGFRVLGACGVTFKNLYIKNGLQNQAGYGIKLDAAFEDVIGVVCGIRVENVFIEYFRYGIRATASIFKSIFTNVIADECEYGFMFDKSGTSLTLINCWATWCTGSGYIIDRCYYSTFLNCACDNCVSNYIIRNSKTISLINCGCESTETAPVSILSCSCINVIGLLASATGSNDNSGIATICDITTSNNISITSCAEVAYKEGSKYAIIQNQCTYINCYNNEIRQILIDGVKHKDFSLKLEEKIQ